jgi:hypothetical protein
MSSGNRERARPRNSFGVALRVLQAAVKDPHQSIGQRSQRLVMRLAPQTQPWPSAIAYAILDGLSSPQKSAGFFGMQWQVLAVAAGRVT